MFVLRVFLQAYRYTLSVHLSHELDIYIFFRNYRFAYALDQKCRLLYFMNVS